MPFSPSAGRSPRLGLIPRHRVLLAASTRAWYRVGNFPTCAEILLMPKRKDVKTSGTTLAGCTTLLAIGTLVSLACCCSGVFSDPTSRPPAEPAVTQAARPGPQAPPAAS